MKDNILIAEFMALPYDSDTREYNFWNNGLQKNMWVHEDDLLFDRSWDWLISVLDTIEERCEGVPQQLIHLTLFSTMREVYAGVMDFIKTCYYQHPNGAIIWIKFYDKQQN